MASSYTKLATFIALLWGALVFLTFVPFAKADVQQLSRGTELSATFNGGGTMHNTQTLGNGFDFELYEIAAWVKRTGGSGIWNFVLYECDENTYTTCTPVFNETGASTNTVAERLAMSATPTVILNPIKYYAFVMAIANGSGNQTSAFGSATDVYSGGAAVNSTAGLPAGTPNPSGTISDWYFEINGAPWWLIATSTQIVPPYTPPIGYIWPDNTVDFTYNYFFSSTPPAYAGFQVENLTTGQTYNTSEGEVSIITSGGGTYTETMQLPEGDAYRWRPYLRYGSSNTFVYGYWSTFSVVYPNSLSSPITPSDTSLGFSTTTTNVFCDDNVPYDDSTIITATITYIPNGLCRVFGFLFIPSQTDLFVFSSLKDTAEQKIPFSYIFGIQNIVNGLIASSTENINTVDIPFPDIASSSPFGSFIPSHIGGLSTTSISTYMPDSVRLSLLNLQRVALWLAFAYLIYRRVIPEKAHV